jgi:hypothetical protein
MYMPWRPHELDFDHAVGDGFLIFEGICMFYAFGVSVSVLIGDLSRFLH